MKHIKSFNDFLKDEVNLNQTRIDKLEQRIESIRSLLKDDFQGFRKMEKQGSYAMKTIIKPVKENGEFDADLLLFLTHDEEKEPADYLKELNRFLKQNSTYANLAKLKTRCVTLDYADEFHIDLVPCIEIDDDTFICNRKANEFEVSDGTGYRKWLNDKTAHTNGYLKHVTRLMKFMRDHKGNFSVKSILMTTLLGNCVDDISKSEFTDIPTALLKIMKSLHEFLEENPEMPIIENPVLPSEDFNRHWDQSKYENFCEKIGIYYTKVKEAYLEEDHNSSIKAWRKIFGEKFGKLKENCGDSNPIITPKKPHSMGW